MQPINLETIISAVINWCVHLFQRFIQPHPKRSSVIALIFLGLLIYLVFFSPQPLSQPNNFRSDPTQKVRHDNELLGHPDQPLSPQPTQLPSTPTPTQQKFGDRTVVMPDRVRTDDQFVISTSVQTPREGEFRVFLDVFTDSNDQVINFAKTVAFQSGVPITIPVDEIVTVHDKQGSYRVRVAIGSPDGKTIYYENQNAAQFWVVR